MAGAGSRFSEVGFKIPKPLIPVHGIPMFEIVVNNLRPSMPHRFIFICQESHIKRHDLNDKIRRVEKNAVVLSINELTRGAAETALFAKSYINDCEPLMIANCDQFIKADIDDYLESFSNSNLDGFIMTMEACDDRWSFVKSNAKGLVTDVREKEVISNDATVGIYNFKYGSEFVKAAEQMIKLDIRHKNEFYIAPAYNELIKLEKKIGIYNIGSLEEKMFGLGTPKDLKNFDICNLKQSVFSK
jgi:NDP-sugar pyrophosphorylase family protein